jgi:hypothetical protein
MNKRFLEAIGAVAAVMALIALLKLAPVRVAGQAPAPANPGPTAQPGPAPRTAWGAPDLQGIWTNEYETPLQRPAHLADKEFYTDAERAELDKQRAGMRTFSDRVAPRGTEQDVAGAYNAVFQSIKHTGRRTSLIVDPPDGRVPPLTAAAQQRKDELREYQLALMQAVETCKTTQEGSCAGVKPGPPSPRLAERPPHYVTTFAFLNRADGPEDFGLGERCMGGNLPDFGGFRRIVQSPGSVSIFYDVGQGQGWQRNIPISASPHLSPQIRQWWGDSRGRWEGDTLVVDVTNFSPKTDFQGSRENLHLIERWTRIDANTIDYAVTLEDPTTWTRPWTVKHELRKQNEQANRIYYEPRCHEGNAGMVGLLAGAREEEKAYAAGRGPHPATKCRVVCGFGLTEDDSDPLR